MIIFIFLLLKKVLRIRIRSDRGLFGSPGSGSEKIPDPLSTKGPCNSNFLAIKLCKIQFHLNNVLSLILSVKGCLDLVRKCHTKYLFC